MPKRTVRLDMEEVQQALRSAKGKLPDEVHKLFTDVAASYASIAGLVRDETMTVDPLREMPRGTRHQQSDAGSDNGTNLQTPPPKDRGSRPET